MVEECYDKFNTEENAVTPKIWRKVTNKKWPYVFTYSDNPPNDNSPKYDNPPSDNPPKDNSPKMRNSAAENSFFLYFFKVKVFIVKILMLNCPRYIKFFPGCNPTQGEGRRPGDREHNSIWWLG